MRGLMTRAAILVVALLGMAATAGAQLKPPPMGLEGFRLMTARDGHTWWFSDEGGWRTFTQPGPGAGSWYQPPIAVISQAELVAMQSDVGALPLPRNNFGLMLGHRPESPGFTTNDSRGDLVLDPIGQKGHVHTADCDGGRCPSPDTPDDPGGEDPELLRRHQSAAPQWLIILGIGLGLLGIGFAGFIAVVVFILVVVAVVRHFRRGAD